MNATKYRFLIMFKILSLGLIVLLFSSCSKELSRGEAKKAILIKENLPSKETRNINFMEEVQFPSTIPYKEEYDRTDYFNISLKEDDKKSVANTPTKLELFEKMERDGLINYTIEITGVRIAGYGNYHLVDNIENGRPMGYRKVCDNIPVMVTAIHYANLTEKGKQYLISDNNVLVATIEFGEITGIIERKELNISEVNYTVKRTDVTPFGRLFGSNEETLNRTSTFTKYDDGWRIEN